LLGIFGVAIASVSAPQGRSAASEEPTCVDAALVGDGATAVYPLDDPSGSAALDVSGNHKTGQITDAAGYDVTPGPFGCAPSFGTLNFNGSSTTVTTAISGRTAAVTGATLTVVAWVKAAAFSAGAGTAAVVADADTGAGTAGGFRLAVGGNGDTGTFDVGTTAGSVGIAPFDQQLSAGTWYMVAGTYDGSTVTSYLDGVPVGSGPASGTVVSGPANVAIGDDPAKGDQHFDGQIGDVAVLPGALSAAQLQSLYLSSSGTTTPACVDPQLVADGAAALYPLNATLGTKTGDVSGNSRTATVTDAASVGDTPGPLGCASAADGALGFDGTATHVTTPIGGTTGAVTGHALTVVAWVNPATSTRATETLVADADTAQSGKGFSLGLTPRSGGGYFSVGTTRTYGLPASWARAAPLATGEWYMVVGTYNGSVATAYLDGSPVATAPASGSVSAGTSPVAIGYDPAASDDDVKGQLADVAILPSSLNAAQVSELYQSATGTPATATWSATPACGGGVVTATPPLGAVSATVDVTGAGGGGSTGEAHGGSGGQATGTVDLDHASGQVSAEVGCGGGAPGPTAPGTGGSGYAAGGAGGSSTTGAAGGGGGGASALCLGANCGVPVVIAGGGGGGGRLACTAPTGAAGSGGSGGGGTQTGSATGGVAATVSGGVAGASGGKGGGTGGGGGTATAGGPGGASKTKSSVGAPGADTPSASTGGNGGAAAAGGGGGGGGYTGGGGGGGGCTSGGGGGGSSAAYSAYQPELSFTGNGGNGGGSAGSGSVNLIWNLSVVSFVTPGPQTTAAGTTADVVIAGADSAGLGLTYSASGLPAGLTINPSTGAVTGVPITAGTYEVTVSAADTQGQTGATLPFPWTVTNGPAAKLVFANAPKAGQAGAPLSPQPVVRVEDRYGNLVTTGPDANDAVSLTFSGGGGQPSTPAATAVAVAGVATFSAVKAPAGGGVTLTATDWERGVSQAVINLNASTAPGTASAPGRARTSGAGQPVAYGPFIIRSLFTTGTTAAASTGMGPAVGADAAGAEGVRPLVTPATLTFASSGKYVLTVPAGTTSVTYTLVGGGGGGGATTGTDLGGAGGAGAKITGVITLSAHASALTLTVIVGGGGMASATATGGLGGTCGTGCTDPAAGGDGGSNTTGHDYASGGGGGGSLIVASTGSDLVVSGGGGGGGAGSGGLMGHGGYAGGRAGTFSSGTASTGASGSSYSGTCTNSGGTGGSGGGGTTTGTSPYNATGGCLGASDGMGPGAGHRPGTQGSPTTAGTGPGTGGTGGNSSDGPSGGGGGGGWAGGGGAGGSTPSGGAGGGGGSSFFRSSSTVSGVTVTVTATTSSNPSSGAGAGGTAAANGSTGSATFTGNDISRVVAPSVTSFTPPSGTTAGGTTVTITGTNFTGVTSVKFGSTTAASYTVTTSTQITAVTKAHAAGTVAISVTNAVGTGTSSSDFKFVPPAPTITSFTPATGATTGGTAVTITGTGLFGATAVTFGSTAAASFTVTSPTQITAFTAAHATGTVTVKVTTAGGTATASGEYKFVAPVLSLSTPGTPSDAPVGSSYTLTLSPSVSGTATHFPTLVVTVPPGERFGAAPAPSTWTCELSNGAKTLTCTANATSTLSTVAVSVEVATTAALGPYRAAATLSDGGDFAVAVGATATVTVTPSTPAQLVFVSPPTSVTAGTTVSLVVHVEDAYGNLVTSGRGSTDTIAVSGATCAATTVPAAGGQATFTDCHLPTTVGGHTVTATDTTHGDTGLRSARATITVLAGPAAELAFTPPPPSVTVGQPFPLIVLVEDAYGNRTYSGTGSSDTVDLSGSPITCTGGTSVRASAGSATFDGCTLATPPSAALTATDATTGDTGYAPARATIAVNPADTSTTVSSSGGTGVLGTPVSYRAVVTADAPSLGVPGGSVEFKDGGGPITGCTAQPLTSGSATCTVTYETLGTRHITAVYLGTPGYATSTSTSWTEDLIPNGLTVSETAAGSNPNASTVALTPVTLSGTPRFQASTGVLNTVHVDDNTGKGTWEVTAQLQGNFANSTGTAPGDPVDHEIPASDLLWSPTVGAGSAAGVVPGAVAALSKTTPSVLCQAPGTGSGKGRSTCGATLKLAVPPWVAAGQYSAVLDIIVS